MTAAVYGGAHTAGRPAPMAPSDTIDDGCRRQNLYQQAILHFTKAVELKPSLSEPHLNLANLYLEKLNDDQKALYHFKTWLRKAPRDRRAEGIRQKIEQIEREKE